MPSDQPPVLIVDEEAGLAAAEESLRQAGLSTLLKARNAQEAWKLLHQAKVRLVLCEVSLPQVSGLQLLQKIRGTKALHHMPVLLMSRSGDPRLAAAAAKAGAAGFLTKPLEPAALKAKLIEALSAKPGGGMAQSKLLAAADAAIEHYRYDDAVKIFSSLLKANPIMGAAYLGLARIFKLKNDKDKHRAFLERAAAAHAQSGEMAEAENAYKDLKKFHPEAGNPFKSAGLALQAQNQPAAAAKVLGKAAEIEPEDDAILLALAQSCRDAGEAEKGLDAAMRILRRQDGSEAAREVYLSLTGEVWDLNPGSAAGIKRKADDEEYERKGTVKFWTPDLFVKTGGRQNMPIVAMSPSSVSFKPLEQPFAEKEAFSFDIIRLLAGGEQETVISGLRATAGELVAGEMRCLLDPEIKERRKAEILEILQAAQVRVKEELKKMGDVKEFEVDMLFI